MKNKTKIILSSILSIILCASLIAGATFALFTNKSEVNIAVTSAHVEVTATVNSTMAYYSAKALEEGDTATMYDENGMGYTQPSTNMQAWTNGGRASVEGGDVTLTNITPGDRVEFQIALKNKSNVKIQYRTVVMLKSAEENAQVEKLAKVLVICKDNEQLSGGNTDPSKDIIYYDQAVDTLYSQWTKIESIPSSTNGDNIGGTDGIKMSIELPLTIGNTYQDEECHLYFAVEAVQYNASTTDAEVVTSAMKNDLEALNDALKDSVGQNNTMYDALVEAKAFIGEGLKSHFIGCLKPEMTDFKATDGREFAWDSKNDQFLLMNGDNVIYPTTGVTTSKVAIFKLANALNASENNGYSLYLTSDYTGAKELTVATGLDVGVNDDIASIKYERLTGDPQEVIIRTNGGKLQVNAPADTINHYGDVGYVDLQACAPHSYYEYGTPMMLDVSNGHVVLTKEAKVGKGIHFSKTGDNFGNGQIILTFEDGAAVPDFTRDEIGTSDLSVLVCTIQHGVESSAEKEYVWLVGDGTIENQNVVVTASTTAPETRSGNLSGFDANTSLLAEKIANIATLGDGEEVTAVTDKGLTAEEKAEVVDAVSHGFYVQLIKDGIVVETTTIVKISEEANDLNPRDFSEYTIKLLSNVDLSETTWLPLGNTAANAFSGCKLFDGNGYTISGITYKEGGTYTSSSGQKITPNGLIGYLGGSITFKDLNIDVNIDNATGSSCGAFIGAMATGDGQKDKTATFIFCNAYGSINCSDKSGGFVGNTYTEKTTATLADNSVYQDNCVVFENCNNYLNITGNNSKGARIGGFVGCMRNDISFTDCTNYGTITVIAETPELPYVAGGFVGYSGEVTALEFSTLKFTRCSNEGKLDAKNIKGTNIKAALPFLGCTQNKFGGSSGTITGSDCLITHKNNTVVAIIVDGNYAKVDYVLGSTGRTIKW